MIPGRFGVGGGEIGGRGGVGGGEGSGEGDGAGLEVGFEGGIAHNGGRPRRFGGEEGSGWVLGLCEGLTNGDLCRGISEIGPVARIGVSIMGCFARDGEDFWGADFGFSLTGLWALVLLAYLGILLSGRFTGLWDFGFLVRLVGL